MERNIEGVVSKIFGGARGMKAGIYMLLKDIVGKLLEYENYTYEITLYSDAVLFP